MSTKKIVATLAAGILALGLAGCGGNDPDDGSNTPEGELGRELKMSTNQTDDHPNNVALRGLADRMRERTDGRINIVIYSNAVLGDQTESMESLQTGVIDLASISAPQLVNLNKDFQVLDLPLVFDSVDHQMECLNDQELMSDLYSSLDDQGLHVSGAYTQGARSMYNNKRPIETPEDVKGLKIRVQETDIQVKMIEAMGGVASPMAFGEVYSALQTGVIDGAENNEVSYLTMKHSEVAQYYSYTNHLIGADLTVINTEVWNSWSDEDKAIWEEEFAASVDHFNELWSAAIEEAVEQTTESGAQFNETDADAFREVLEPVTEAALVTENQRQLYEAFRDRA